MPKAGWGGGGKGYPGAVSLWPWSVPAPHLSDFLAFPLALLSARAAGGFLSRAEVSSLHFDEKPGFLDDVRRHVVRMSRKAVA